MRYAKGKKKTKGLYRDGKRKRTYRGRKTGKKPVKIYQGNMRRF